LKTRRDKDTGEENRGKERAKEGERRGDRDEGG
jgi:hypothetical protein